jgi:membrane protease YdiL (CAAX protease family)
VVKTSTSDRLPPSPTRSPKHGFTWWISVLFAGLLAVALFIPSTFVLVALMVSGLLHQPDLHTLSWQLIVAQMVGYAAALAVIFPLLPILAQRPWRALGLRPLRWRDVAFALAGAVVMFFAVAATGALQEAVFHLKPDEVQVQWFHAVRGSLVAIAVVFACIAAPFVEEILFRGFLFNALLRYMPAWIAVVLSATAFGFSHYQPGNAGAIAPLAAGGVVLALVYYGSGSLVASMLTHAVFNSITVIAILVFHQG